MTIKTNQAIVFSCISFSKEEYDGVKNAYKVLRDDYAAIMSEADDLESRCKKAEEMLLVAEVSLLQFFLFIYFKTFYLLDLMM